LGILLDVENVLSTSDRSSDRRPDPTLQRRASCCRIAMYPARELAVFVIFLHGFHAYISIFNTSIASLGTDEHIAKICQNGTKVNVGCVSSSSNSYAGSSPDF